MANINGKIEKITGKIKYQNVLEIIQMKNSYCLLRIILKWTYNIEKREIKKAIDKKIIHLLKCTCIFL